MRPSQGSQREGHSSPNPKENEGKNKCYVSSARNTVPFLTLLNHASQEAEYFRKYIWVAGNRRLDRSSCPAASGPIVFGSCDVLRWDPWECPVPCSVERTVLTPAAHSISQPVWTSGPFPLWDAACHGKRFQKLHELLFQQTKCQHSDKQTLACFLYHSRCTACSDCLPHWKE